VGPTQATLDYFGDRLEAQNIGDIQAKYPDQNNGLGGSHSTVNIPEIFQMDAEYLERPFPLLTETPCDP
jgi:hypothetical protein